MYAVAKIYANQIYEGKRTIEQVPKKYRPDTIEWLWKRYGMRVTDPDAE